MLTHLSYPNKAVISVNSTFAEPFISASSSPIPSSIPEHRLYYLLPLNLASFFPVQPFPVLTPIHYTYCYHLDGPNIWIRLCHFLVRGLQRLPIVHREKSIPLNPILKALFTICLWLTFPAPSVTTIFMCPHVPVKSDYCLFPKTPYDSKRLLIRSLNLEHFRTLIIIATNLWCSDANSFTKIFPVPCDLESLQLWISACTILLI